MRGIEIISDDRADDLIDTKQRIKELFAHKDIEPFKSVDDPLAWQQAQRDEW